MPKDTKKTGKSAKAEKPKKANPALEEDTDLEDEEDTEEETDEETSDETDTDEDTEETDEDDADASDEDETEEDDEVEEKPAKKPAKGSKGGKKPLIEREPARVRGRSSIEEEMKQDADNIKAVLEKQPKVRMFIPLGIGEKKGAKGAFESVTINGFRMVFPKGEYISVPESVALILEEHYGMTPESTEAGEAFRLDRSRSKDGMTTEEALG